MSLSFRHRVAVVLLAFLAVGSRQAVAQISSCHSNPSVAGNLLSGCAFDSNSDLSFWAISGKGSSDAWIPMDSRGMSGGSAVIAAVDDGTAGDGVALFQQCVPSVFSGQNYSLAFAYNVQPGQCAGGFMNFTAYVVWMGAPSCGGATVLTSIMPTLTFDGTWRSSGLALVSPMGGQSAQVTFDAHCGQSGSGVGVTQAFVDEVAFGCLLDVNSPIITPPVATTVTQSTCL